MVDPVNDPVIVEPETLSEVYGRVFYGLRYNPATGVAYFEKIENDEIISLPDPNSISVDDYQTWLSSKKYLDFTWETATSSNLIMEVS
ncbi:MAG: hypothetical protein EBT80_00040 [Chitinophagales bacterium]|jgi:hypothetical protein|nr:hypothetical protein [Chitinophagales bacterium]